MRFTSVIIDSRPRAVAAILLVVLAGLPLHAPFSVYMTSTFGLEQVWQSWKEILILLASILGLIELIKDKKLLKKLAERRVNRFVLGFVLVHLLLALWQPTDQLAESVGLVFNLRFVAVFGLAQIAAERLNRERLLELAAKIFFYAGAAVVTFGALQVTVLPDDILGVLGYGPDTIEPFRTIDENDDFVRVNSTLRGPNPLGLYLVLYATWLTALWFKRFKYLSKLSVWRLGLLSALTLITLYGSHSRSAWLGAAAAMSLVVWWLAGSKLRRQLLLAGAAAGALMVVLAALNWQSDFVQNTVLHRDPDQGSSINSTEEHFSSTARAVSDIASDPLGDGPGTAGPASFYNETQSARISENYYLQIGQETGWLGLGLFILLLAETARCLYVRRREFMPAVLLAGLAGLSVAALFLHVWAQDEIALSWWLLAGLVIRPGDYGKSKLV